MALIRTLLAQRHLAMLICVAALAIKLLIPGGYMLSSDHGQLTIIVCPGVADTTVTMPGAAAMPMAMPGMPDHRPEEQHGAVEMPCAFSGLAHQALGAADPVLLAAAIAFVIAMGTAPTPRPFVASVAHLRPPLRGPPAF